MAKPKKVIWKGLRAAKRIKNIIRKMRRTPRSKKVR